MTQIKCIVSSTLLTAGILLVFGGLSQALGFTLTGMIASGAVIATLLYAGGVWFGASTPPRGRLDQVIVFDRMLRVSCGLSSGSHVASLFPASMRSEIEARCAAALAGHAAHFTCDHEGETVGFDAAPVRAADGTILYGMLITGTAARPSAVAACIAS